MRYLKKSSSLSVRGFLHSCQIASAQSPFVPTKLIRENRVRINAGSGAITTRLCVTGNGSAISFIKYFVPRASKPAQERYQIFSIYVTEVIIHSTPDITSEILRISLVTVTIINHIRVVITDINVIIKIISDF